MTLSRSRIQHTSTAEGKRYTQDRILRSNKKGAIHLFCLWKDGCSLIISPVNICTHWQLHRCNIARWTPLTAFFLDNSRREVFSPQTEQCKVYQPSDRLNWMVQTKCLSVWFLSSPFLKLTELCKSSWKLTHSWRNSWSSVSSPTVIPAEHRVWW